MTAQRILDEKGGEVISVQPNLTLRQAAQVLTEHRIGAVIVLDEGADQPLGVFSERDLARLVAERGAEALEHPVRAVMSTTLVTATPQTDVNTLMAVMTERRVRHILILQDGGLVGVVSIGDVVKRRIADVEADAAALRAYIETA